MHPPPGQFPALHFPLPAREQELDCGRQGGGGGCTPFNQECWIQLNLGLQLLLLLLRTSSRPKSEF